MTEYREILRLHSMGFSQRNIAYSCHASKTTVSRVLKKAKELGIAWPLDENQTNGVLAKLFSTPSGKPEDASPKPDFVYIRKELMRSGVTKKTALGRVYGRVQDEQSDSSDVLPVLSPHQKRGTETSCFNAHQP